MATKMTKKDYFAEILALSEVQNNSSYVEFITHEIELLNKPKKPKKGQEENEVIKSVILDGMDKETLYTVTDLIKTVEGLQDYTNQKISALMKQLVENGDVERIAEGKKTLFQVAAASQEVE